MKQKKTHKYTQRVGMVRLTCGRVSKARPYDGVQDIVHIVTQTVEGHSQKISAGTRWLPT